MKLRHSMMILLACLMPALTLANEGRLVFDTVHSQALEGNLLGDSADRSVIVYLPPSYDTAPTKHYPVVYLLHPYLRHNTVWTDGCYQGFRVKDVLDSLITAGIVREMIIAMPDAYNLYQGSFYTNSPVTGHWEDFITRDLVAYIDSTYRTFQNAASRGIAGHSMGGYGALTLGMRHPEVYRAIYGMSAALGRNFDLAQQDSASWAITLNLKGMQDFLAAGVPSQVTIAGAAAFSPNPNRPPFYVDFPFEFVNGQLKQVEPVVNRWRKSNPLEVLDQYRSNLLQMRGIGFDVGTSDQSKGIPVSTRTLHQALTKAGIPHVFEEYDGGHNNRIRERMVTKVLPFFSTALVFE